VYGVHPNKNTIGIVVVAAFAANAAGVLAGVVITATPRRTSSAASCGRRALSFCAQRNSIATLRPST
jgi:hypothetical protein